MVEDEEVRNKILGSLEFLAIKNPRMCSYAPATTLKSFEKSFFYRLWIFTDKWCPFQYFTNQWLNYTNFGQDFNVWSDSHNTFAQPRYSCLPHSWTFNILKNLLQTSLIISQPNLNFGAKALYKHCRTKLISPHKCKLAKPFD